MLDLQQVHPEAPLAELSPDVGQRLGVDDAGPQLGQVPLAAIGMAVVELVGDGQAQHGVAEKLQPLVGRQPAVFVGVAAVRQRQGQQFVGQLNPEGVEQSLP
ncbi:hypothetical protein MINTM025_37840 [Mycobacterium intracellulare]|nr:hypothetical protein MINTM025_37840 [Mycobacterium intracellulare]